MSEDTKNAIIQELNLKIGDDINDLSSAVQIENELISKKEALQRLLNIASDSVPTKISDAIQKAHQDTLDIELIKERNRKFKEKVEMHYKKWGSVHNVFGCNFAIINKLEELLTYMKTFDRINVICKQLKQCNDHEQLVSLYLELRGQSLENAYAQQTEYVKKIACYWHRVLKEKMTKTYKEILDQLKWPFRATVDNSPPPKEVIAKFTSLTKSLFIIQEPEDIVTSPTNDDLISEPNPSLPIRLLLDPLKKRFYFHFTGRQQTARIDRPEWFLTQTLIWIKDHQEFVRDYVQPMADEAEINYEVRAVDEFNGGLIKLAAERLYNVLSLYQSDGEEIEDVDAAFAHAVDETLGFHRELVAATEKESSSVLAVLTKANIFIQWLAVEKKYALSKLDEMLENEQWIEPCAGGAAAAVGAGVWVPRGAALFVTLLKTIEDRYKMLPQPGHRLQFLELQLELVEEWRIRLTQILSAAVTGLNESSFLDASSPHPLTATINAAHHTATTLMHLHHSLHYLQLHYYRRQFQHFTQQQHHDEEDDDQAASVTSSMEVVEEERKAKAEGEIEETLSLKEVEVRARKLALNEVSRQASVVNEDGNKNDASSPITSPQIEQLLLDDQSEDSTVFGEAPSLLCHLRDAGLQALADHILLEFKATLKLYKKQKWHAMPMVEESALTISTALCRGLSALCARLSSCAARLAPPLTQRLRAQAAAAADQCLYQEVVLDSWFNTGGTIQFTHDVKRNLVPAFAPPNMSSTHLNQLPKLLESCKLLNMDFDEARRLRATLNKNLEIGEEDLVAQGIKHIPPQEALQILSQRTDLSQASQPSSVLELF